MTAEDVKAPFLLPVEDVAKDFGVNLDRGLSSAQVAQLQQSHPPNEIDAGNGIPWYKIFLKQLFNAMVLVS